MVNPLIPSLVVAVLSAASVVKADTTMVPKVLPDMTYCEKNGDLRTDCFVREGNPAEYPKYVFVPGEITERLPAPSCDRADDCEYLERIVYNTSSPGTLASVTVVTERRIGDRFIQRQDFPEGAYRLTDRRTGEEISLCLPTACSGTQYRKTKRTITDQKTKKFQEYNQRFHMIMGRYYGLQAR